MKKRIVLCADDYGQTSEISAGIVDLINKGRLSATSCLTNSSNWLKHANWLIPFRGKVDLGLHFNLTEGQPLSEQFRAKYGSIFGSLPHLLAKSFLRQLDQSVIETELTAQLDRFEEALGRVPDFIDGHQHIHQFPVIRTALINVYERRLRLNNSYIRSTIDHDMSKSIKFDHKQWIIYLSGAKAFKQLLKARNILHNASFAGVYRFAKAPAYRGLFRCFLSQIGDKGLIMCHPGMKATQLSDKIMPARVCEYQYLASDSFLLDCEQHNVAIQAFQSNS